MELERQRACEIAEHITEIAPWTCRVNLFSEETEDGRYMATVSVALGDPTEPADITHLIEQLHAIHALAEAEGLTIEIGDSLDLVLSAR